MREPIEKSGSFVGELPAIVTDTVKKGELDATACLGKSFAHLDGVYGRDYVVRITVESPNGSLTDKLRSPGYTAAAHGTES